MQADIFDQKNNKVDEVNLPDRIFKTEWNPALVHQALIAQMSNRRQAWAHTKDRSEVRGGGRKPWRQKGTGRARHGSIRSPLWIGGGVTFGPRKEKDYSKKINKKMRQKAVFSVLSKKLQDDGLKIVDSLKIETLKTKVMAEILKNLIKKPFNALIIPSSDQSKIKKIVSNIKNINAISPFSLNVYDLLRYKNIILEKEAIKEIEKHYNKTNNKTNNATF